MHLESHKPHFHIVKILGFWQPVHLIFCHIPPYFLGHGLYGVLLAAGGALDVPWVGPPELFFARFMRAFVFVGLVFRFVMSLPLWASTLEPVVAACGAEPLVCVVSGELVVLRCACVASDCMFAVVSLGSGRVRELGGVGSARWAFDSDVGLSVLCRFALLVYVFLKGLV